MDNVKNTRNQVIQAKKEFSHAQSRLKKATTLFRKEKIRQRYADKYIILISYDNLWKAPQDDTLVFTAVCEDGRNTPIHANQTCYRDLVRSHAFPAPVTDYWFSKDKACELADKFNNNYPYSVDGYYVNHAKAIPVVTFIKMFGFLDPDDTDVQD